MGSERPFGLADNGLAAKTAVGIRAISAANTRVMPFTYTLSTLLSVVCQVLGMYSLVAYVAATLCLPDDSDLLSTWATLLICCYYRICFRTILKGLQLQDGYTQVVAQSNQSRRSGSSKVTKYR